MLGFWLVSIPVLFGLESHRRKKSWRNTDSDPYKWWKSSEFYKANNTNPEIERYKVFIRTKRKYDWDKDTIKLHMYVHYANRFNSYFKNKEEAAAFVDEYWDC